MEELASKSIRGVLSLLIALLLLIFLSAWTLTYWQGWAYILAFFLPTWLITRYLFRYDRSLLQRRLEAGAAAEQEKNQQYIQAISGLLVIGLIISSALDWRFKWSHVSGFISCLADVVIVAAFYLVFRVFKENSYTIATIKVDMGQSVIKTGPYALVRHPMYSGALLIFLATPLALGSYWALLIGFLLIITLAFRALDEEQFLQKNLAGYIDYCSSVNYRFIPFVW